ncbi:hypothetical protein EH206_19720 [Brenneria nigrifluens DSM 30175 = ATCC 13028]|uniref:Uncharacterized protein n=1 Tax=Brenneria nigrifluens DSM 30175 = ATCC 13028 TaxID=1121120 RepID=A0A2U1UPE2_9GAMM|nr:hypothetical protein BrE312_3915 [Brenneria sp. EniD312]PWC23442.1 hypothetical protein DDT54_14410 [Brenneria nigrifluens DSM 30175 = ATCC 13028]QCR06183.1 hypothetical protein EH206_19720 [Brenneria nigrifluens DSM 30175 = ATCC 13028]
MGTNEIISTQTQGQLVSTDFNRFEQFLESLGLPKENVLASTMVDLTLYIQTFLLSYGCDNFLRIYSRGERYPSALCG